MWRTKPPVYFVCFFLFGWICGPSVWHTLSAHLYWYWQNSFQITFPWNPKFSWNLLHHVRHEFSHKWVWKKCHFGQFIPVVLRYYDSKYTGDVKIMSSKSLNNIQSLHIVHVNWWNIWSADAAYIEGILPKAPYLHAYAWRVGPFWQGTLNI